MSAIFTCYWYSQAVLRNTVCSCSMYPPHHLHLSAFHLPLPSSPLIPPFLNLPFHFPPLPFLLPQPLVSPNCPLSPSTFPTPPFVLPLHFPPLPSPPLPFLLPQPPVYPNCPLPPSPFHHCSLCPPPPLPLPSPPKTNDSPPFPFHSSALHATIETGC